MDFSSLPKVIAVVGSRDYPRLDWVGGFIRRLPGKKLVVSGEADGVDLAAKKAALHYRHGYKPFKVENDEWELLGKSVGPTRNELLVRYVKRYEGYVVIFANVDNGVMTPGSTNVKSWCEKLHVPYTLYDQEGNVL
jgi:hypothetical protein